MSTSLDCITTKPSPISLGGLENKSTESVFTKKINGHISSADTSEVPELYTIIHAVPPEALFWDEDNSFDFHKRTGFLLTVIAIKHQVLQEVLLCQVFFFYTESDSLTLTQFYFQSGFIQFKWG